MKLRTKTKIVFVCIFTIIIGALTTGIRVGGTAICVRRHMELGVKYISDLDYEQALAEYLAVIDIDPKNIDAYIGAAEAYMATDNSVEAMKVLFLGYQNTQDENIKKLIDDIRNNNYASADNDDVNVSQHYDIDNEVVADSNEYELLKDYYDKEIVNEYGILTNLNSDFSISRKYVESDIEDIMDKYSEWLGLEGVLMHIIEDLDQDGKKELLIIRFVKDSDLREKNYDNFGCVIDLYRVEGDSIIKNRSVNIGSYHAYGSLLLYVSMIRKQDKIYFVCRNERDYYLLSDGYDSNLVVLDGGLSKCAEVFQNEGGSDGFQYTMRKFDGYENVIDEKLIYNNDEGYDPNVAKKDLYAIFSELGIRVSNIQIEYPFRLSIEDLLSEERDLRMLLSYKVISTVDFKEGGEDIFSERTVVLENDEG